VYFIVSYGNFTKNCTNSSNNSLCISDNTGFNNTKLFVSDKLNLITFVYMFEIISQEIVNGKYC